MRNIVVYRKILPIIFFFDCLCSYNFILWIELS